MALPNPPQNPNTPIPNNPFFAPLNAYVQGAYFPIVAGQGIDFATQDIPTLVNDAGAVLAAGAGISLSTTSGVTTITSTGGGGGVTQILAGSNILISPVGGTGTVTISAAGGGSGTVTAISAGNGLNGGTITTSGSLSLNNNCVIPPSAFNIKGNLLAGTGAGTYTALNPGTDGQVLSAYSSAGASGICWSNVGTVTAVSGNAPISVATGTTTPNISIASASTTASGAVQLNNTLVSTSTALALTAAQGKVLQDQIDTLLVAGTIELAGTLDASTGLVASVTSVGTADGYTVGAVLPAASATTNNTYVIVTTPGTITPPGGTSTVATRGDWFLVSETSPGVYAWTFLNVGFDAPAASTTVPGVVELATNAETATGTDATTAVTPAGAAFAYIAKTALTAKGALVSATAASTPSALAVGTDGQVLVACAAATTGLCWVAPTPTGIPCACITAKGSLISGTAAATPTALPVGTDGDVLVACATAATGLCWTAPTPSGIPCACVLGKGALVTGTAGSTPAGLSVGLDGQLLVACAAATTGLCWVTVPVTLPATPTVAGIVLGCTDTSNAALGCNALLTGSGTGHVAVGLGSLRSNTTGVNNVAVGNAASCSNTVGSGNVAIGTAALFNAVDASRIVAIGENALCAQTTGGQYNVALGWAALCNATGTAGGSNVALGALAGNNITTGASNVAIGPNVTVPFGNQDNQLAIGYNTGQCWLTGDSSKNVKFWAGIRANDNSLGSSGQVLTSTGSGVQWASPSSGGSSWVSVGSLGSGNAVPLFTSGGGAVQINAGYNGVWKQQVSSKIWNVIYQVRATSSAGIIGAGGDFVFNLPSGLSFDTSSLPFQNTFTGSVQSSSHANRQYFLPGASSTQFNAGAGNGSQFGSGVAVWSGNQFRFFITSSNDGGPRAWGSNYWNNPDTSINIGFQFQTP